MDRRNIADGTTPRGVALNAETLAILMSTLDGEFFRMTLFYHKYSTAQQDCLSIYLLQIFYIIREHSVQLNGLFRQIAQ